LLQAAPTKTSERTSGHCRPKTTRHATRLVSLKLPEELDDEITALARRRGTTRSAIVRQALRMYAERGGRDVKGTFAEKARRFRGCLAGPVDLSSNADHLDGYGK
jgi:Arc/MetJ-type ribon-helix-helix transcriptional regulator